MAVIDRFFREMKDCGASDLHMAIGFPPLIRLRGELEPLKADILTETSIKEILYEILTDEQREHFEENLDYDMSYSLEGTGRFRCNFLFQHRGAAGVFRLIPDKILTLDQLNLPDVLQKICQLNSGLVLVTGPTGSGKSTTLAAMIDYINKNQGKHIITIEDPIEFVHSNIKAVFTHREIGTHADSFSDALMVAGREDPDIILVGEMRDLDTIALALQCAELGILVFGTLHTNSAAKTIDRIISAFPANRQAQTKTMLAESLKAVVAQQLLKTSDGKGRCAANEILLGSPALASIIREGRLSQIPNIMQTGINVGMQSMESHLEKLVRDGIVTQEAAELKGLKVKVTMPE